MKKKLYVCPQTDIQKVETGILCASGGPRPTPGQDTGDTGLDI